MLARRFVSRATMLRRCLSTYPSHQVVGLPALSPTMEQGNLAKWNMKEGDAINAGDIICQIETDKAIVDYEAQDDMFLARILVPEGTEGIVVGQPIMITVDDADHVNAFEDYVVDAAAVPAPKAKSPEEIPPKKEVIVDPATNAPVAPADFLVTSQVPQKVVPGPEIPAPVVKAETPKPKPAAPAAATPAANSLNTFAKWGTGIQMSPISNSLLQRQKAYLALYGITGTFPVENKKKHA
ncbi:dihydrolipoyllysine-residue acetyltransferase component of pyruvate dehydrogenase complex [Thraustotheca clavata]|uniref:Dihydrolipoyllysine-residue acetyltransferase component of pyruvate dehydrogenase complex n=1 Tax=Thraustotheca clavata TaxID=74557 RepID=A0A1V9Z404_9STRA|nr:dihydrolipoyllysine-residue acetyltransferase component of pyruvate dehydrogenase complex [Thraustotheca clavata]